MAYDIYSIRSRAGVGNVAIGACLVALSAFLALNPSSWLTLCAAICLLVLGSLSLFTCLSPRREESDEMSVAHDGQAAGHAFRITLIGVGLACLASIIVNVRVNVAAFGIGIIGFALLTYGIAFASLER